MKLPLLAKMIGDSDQFIVDVGGMNHFTCGSSHKLEQSLFSRENPAVLFCPAGLATELQKGNEM